MMERERVRVRERIIRKVEKRERCKERIRTEEDGTCVCQMHEILSHEPEGKKEIKEGILNHDLLYSSQV